MVGGVETFLELEPVKLLDRVADAYVQGLAQRRSRLTHIRFPMPGFRAARFPTRQHAVGCLRQIDPRKAEHV